MISINTSYSLQSNAAELLDIQRKRLYGKEASAKDYRDSYVLGHEIEDFSFDDVNKLLEYKEQDSNIPKAAKSVTLRANTYTRLTKITALLGLSESEVCRLIIYHFANEMHGDTNAIPPKIEEELATIRKALDDAGRALKTIENYYNNKEYSL